MENSKRSLYITVGVSFLAGLVLMIGILAGGVLLSPYLNGNVQAAALPPAQLAADNNEVVAAYEQALIDVYQETAPSVVNIQVTRRVDERFLERFGFGTPDEEDIPEFFNQGGGSGFVWDNEGHIITNYHVVADATDIEVSFADDTSVKAELVGSDPDADLAVIQVDLPAEALKPVKLGDSDNLQVGQLAIAIGSPFGQDFTMTSGIISGIGRVIRGGNSGFSIPEVIQTDAPINPGNSGGPLLNRQGEVLGINAQILSQSGASSGVGFAIPINIARQVIPTLIEGETYQYAWLGISGGAVTAEVAEFRNLPADTKGALVIDVIEDGPAETAGLHGGDETLDPESDAFRFGGDIITAINGQPVKDINDLITYLVKETEPDDVVTLAVIQADGQATQVEITLGVRPSAEAIAAEE